MGTKDLISVMGGRLDPAALVLAFWTAFEVFRTLYAWRWPAEAELEADALAAQNILGLTDELSDARRHRNVELVILGFAGALQVFCAARSVLEPWRWLYYAFTMGSLLLVESMGHRLPSCEKSR